MLILKRMLILLLVLLIPSVAAAEFVIGSSTNNVDACASETAVIIVTTTNTGDSSDTYTLTLSGDSFAVAAPSGFVLQPGQSKNSYIYITVPSDTLSGQYALTVSVSSNSGGQQTQSYSLNVGDCHSVSVIPASSSSNLCTCTSGTMDVAVHNTGKWTENFRLSLAGNAAKWATLSEDIVALQSGESKVVTLSVEPTCGDTGDFEATVTAESLNSNAVSSATVDIGVDGCYDFDFAPVENYLSFCDNSEAKVPVNIQNKGTMNNGYDIEIDGPDWATFDKKRVVVHAGKVETTNLVLFPTFGVTGNFPMAITVTSEQGDLEQTESFTANVMSCRQASFELSQNYDFICAGTSKSYEASLLNAGQFQERYSVSVRGPTWAKLNQNFVSLDPEESAIINLDLEPYSSIAPGTYTIMVEAKSQNIGRASDSDTLEIKVPDRASCFGVTLDSENDEAEIAIGEGELIPIIVNNVGSSSAKYELEVSGDGAKLAQLNPGVVELEGSDAETLYLHLSAPDDTSLGTYKVVVSARNADDKTVTGSAVISVEVVESKASVSSEEVTSEITEGIGGIGIISRSMQSISSIFSTGASVAKSAVSQSKDAITDYWHIALIILGSIMFLIVVWRYGIFKRSEDDWFEDLEDLFAEEGFDEPKVEEPKKSPKAEPEEEKQPGLWRKFTDWLTEEDEDDFDFEYEEPKPLEKEKKAGLWTQFKAWLEEEDTPSREAKPKKPVKKPVKKPAKSAKKKSERTLWQRMTDWMFEEVEGPAKPAKKPAKKDKKGLWQKFVDWLYEEEEAPKKPAKKKAKKEESAWQKFKDWLEEED